MLEDADENAIIINFPDYHSALTTIADALIAHVEARIAAIRIWTYL